MPTRGATSAPHEAIVLCGEWHYQRTRCRNLTATRPAQRMHTLTHFRLCPFSRAARLALAELNVEVELIEATAQLEVPRSIPIR